MNKVLISLIAVFGFMMQSSVYAGEVSSTSEAVPVSAESAAAPATAWLAVWQQCDRRQQRQHGTARVRAGSCLTRQQFHRE